MTTGGHSSPGVPNIFPLCTPTATDFAVSGRHGFGWYRDGWYRKKKPIKFIVRREGLFTRTLASFPFTEAGWAEAWEFLRRTDPGLADAVSSRIAAQAQRESAKHEMDEQT